MSTTQKEWGILATGVIIGLVLSAGFALSTGTVIGDGPPARPKGVPPTAAWSKTILGGPHWFACDGSGKTLQCTAYSPGGVELMSAQFVSADGKPLPGSPTDDIIAQNVDKIWVSKVPFVPNGIMKFPIDAVGVEYANGKRIGEPKPL